MRSMKTFKLPPAGIREAHAALEKQERETGVQLDPEGRAGYLRAALLNTAQRAAIEGLAVEFPAYARAIAYAPIRDWASAITTARAFVATFDPTHLDLDGDAVAAEDAKRRRGLEAIEAVARAFGVSVVC
jgi:hypothetical protein